MDLHDDLSAITKSALLVLVGGIISKAIILLERIILGNTFPVEVFGEINLGIAVVTLFSIITTAGLTQGMPRYLPRAATAEEKRTIIVIGVGVSLVVSILGTGLLLATRHSLFAYLFDAETSQTMLTVFILCIPAVTMLKIAVSVVRGFEITRYKFLVMDVLYPVVRLALILVLLFFGFTFFSVPVAYLVALLLGIAVSIGIIHRLIRLPGSIGEIDGELVRFSFPLMLSATMAVLLTKTDTFMLGLLSDSYEVGLYTAGYPLAASLPIVLGAFGFMYLPVLSRRDSGDEYTDVSSLYYLTAKWSYLLTFPLFAVLFAFSGDVLALLYGPNYRQGGTALSILAIGFLVHVAAGRNRETISALGYPRMVLLLNATSLLPNILLNLVLIPEFGHVGAAVASAITFIVVTMFAYGLLRRRGMVESIPRWNIKAYFGLPILILPFALGLSSAVELNLLGLPFVVLLLYPLTALGALVLGAVQRDDVELILRAERQTGMNLERLRQFLESVTD